MVCELRKGICFCAMVSHVIRVIRLSHASPLNTFMINSNEVLHFSKKCIVCVKPTVAYQHYFTSGIVFPDGKVHGTNMGPTWVLSAPDGPHVGPMNLAIRVNRKIMLITLYLYSFLFSYSIHTSDSPWFIFTFHHCHVNSYLHSSALCSGSNLSVSMVTLDQHPYK